MATTINQSFQQLKENLEITGLQQQTVSTRLRFLAIHLSDPFNIGRRHYLYPLHEAREMVVTHPTQSARHPHPGPFFHLFGLETGVFGVVTVTVMATPSFPKSTHHLIHRSHAFQISSQKPERSTHKPARITPALGIGNESPHSRHGTFSGGHRKRFMKLLG